MVRLLKINLFLLLCSGLITKTLGKEEEEGFARKVLNQLEGMPGILGQAAQIWGTFESLINIFSPTTETSNTDDDRSEELIERIDQLSSDMKGFENSVTLKIEHVGYVGQLESRLNRLFSSIEKIDSQYSTFLDYTNDSLIFFDKDMKDFLDEIEKYDPIKNHLAEMHRAFGSTDLSSRNVPMLLKVPSIAYEHMCTLGQSAQQTIWFLFQQIMMTEVKAYAMLYYANEYKKARHHKKETSHDLQIRNLIEKRTSKTIEIAKRAMEDASRELRKCDVENPQEGEDYARVGPVFQKYIINQLNTYNVQTKERRCEEECSDLKLAQYISYTSPKKSNIPKHLDICHGNIINCEKKGKENSYCVAHDGYRRYEFVRYDDEVFGREDQDCPKSDDFDRLPNGKYYGHDCDNCLCTCESNSTTIDKYIYLMPVISDYKNHKVVAGVRLILENNAFHIQIKQGKLLPSGSVVPDDDWTPVDNDIDKKGKNAKNYFEIAYDKRNVHLAEFDSSSIYDKNHVLTGLGFEDIRGKLRLNVYLSEFNKLTGKLGDPKGQIDQFGEDDSRISKIPMDDLDVPDRYKNDVIRSAENEYLQFTTSDFKKDAGQNVLPFIDIQPIEPNPPVAFAGAGLFLRADEKQESGGYLALKLFTIDAASFLKSTDSEVDSIFDKKKP